MKTGNNYLKTLLGIIISVFFLWLSFRNVDVHEVLTAFSNTNFVLMLPTLLLLLFSFYIRAIRWKRILSRNSDIRMKVLFNATIIGYAANNILPSRLGEIVRAMIVSRKTGISKSRCFASLVFERILDGFSLIFMLGILLLLSSYEFPDWLNRSFYLLGTLYGALIIMMLLFFFRKEMFIKVTSLLLFFVSANVKLKVIDFIHSFSKGFTILSSPKDLLIVILQSLVIWVPNVLFTYFVMQIFGLDLEPGAALILLVAISASSVLPSAPGFWGTLQFVSVVILGIFGIEKSTALSFAIVFHLIQYVPITLAGMILYVALGFNLKKLKEERSSQEVAARI